MNYLDLFSGIGGFHLGLKWAGFKFDKVFYSDIDDYANKVYAKNFPDAIAVGDARKIYRFADEYKKCPDCEEPYCDLCNEHFADCNCIGCSQWDDEYGNVDILTAGFPCQDISIAGKGNGLSGENSKLWYEAKRLISVFLPGIVILENVPALTFRGLGTILGGLAEEGYNAEWICLSASSVGALHKRERIFIVAYPTNNRFKRCFDAKSNENKKWGIMAQIPVKRSIFISEGEFREQVRTARFIRKANGIPNWVDRTKALGNAVVPQVVQLIGETILESGIIE